MAPIYKPEVFQGNLRKKNYFEGWYFKNTSADLNHVVAFIPGISLNHDDPHSFIQVIDGVSQKSEYFSFPVSDFSFRKDSLYVRVAGSVFTSDSISIDIENSIKGEIAHHGLVRYPLRIFSPGIMGWYSFIPFMECKHGIVSVNHDLTGNLEINGEMIDFTGGKGYIEKDWGSSFPEAWFWVQANNFTDPGTSFCFSVAKIPWLGSFFIGFIGFLYFNKKFLLFSTYNHSKLKRLVKEGNTFSLSLQSGSYILESTILTKEGGDLRAPLSGRMTRRIKENIDSETELTLFDLNDNIIYSDVSTRSGVEVIDKIFDLIDH